MAANLTRDQKFSSRALFAEGRGVSVDWSVLRGVDGAAFVDGLSNHINNSTESLSAHGHEDGGTSVLHFLTSHESFGRVKSNSSDVVASQMLGNFEHESVRGSLDLEGVENRREVAVELHVDDGSDDLGDSAD